MAAPVDAQRELDLIEKAEWRILSASSDEAKLQGLLKVYLAPLLLKAGSEHVSVRNKVISTCQTINKLVKSPGYAFCLAWEDIWRTERLTCRSGLSSLSPPCLTSSKPRSSRLSGTLT
ncbi:hypothetical protein MYCTH_2295527 [Thermothelomyces thermophilus ATCC 42464]|uniref:Proteasome component Ecm29 N-terminal domain-containing protein n=1 Tax=Thermothelomyces thermophilus (strain ATCC 42464 / BCRC 31852 / DSM 1799) TaxID=573729 RepID=G2Q5C9_THET4|nr:uncharacterized protein MYCTH_2295527 [Thermothelomyces thermophilus ATCC 42464]AEO53760.1 hypothetical protein MYCTH_2295527 [Thermothelomyces thermophilus ATCC 42464]